MSDAYLNALTYELRTHGVTDWLLDDQGRHYKLRFEWAGKKMMHVFPRSPSDTRGLLNSVRDLRNSMGVRRVIRKPETKDKVRAKPVTPIKPLTITVKPDPFAVLKNMGKQKEPDECPTMTLSQIVEMLRSIQP